MREREAEIASLEQKAEADAIEKAAGRNAQAAKQWSVQVPSGF